MKRPEMNPGGAHRWREYTWDDKSYGTLRVVNDAGRGMLKYIKELEAYADHLEMQLKAAVPPLLELPVEPAKTKVESQGKQIYDLQKLVAKQQKQLDSRPTTQGVERIVLESVKKAVAEALSNMQLRVKPKP